MLHMLNITPLLETVTRKNMLDYRNVLAKRSRDLYRTVLDLPF